MVKLETRIPAGFLNGITALVPQVSGINIDVSKHMHMQAVLCCQAGRPGRCGTA